jgi:hypothetical protein
MKLMRSENWRDKEKRVLKPFFFVYVPLIDRVQDEQIHVNKTILIFSLKKNLKIYWNSQLKLWKRNGQGRVGRIGGRHERYSKNT